MKVLITSVRDPEWVLGCTLIRETETKYIVWSNARQTIEMHFPKHLYNMNKINNTDV